MSNPKGDKLIKKIRKWVIWVSNSKVDKLVMIEEIKDKRVDLKERSLGGYKGSISIGIIFKTSQELENTKFKWCWDYKFCVNELLRS